MSNGNFATLVVHHRLLLLLLLYINYILYDENFSKLDEALSFAQF